jgi:hypothetical protein
MWCGSRRGEQVRLAQGNRSAPGHAGNRLGARRVRPLPWLGGNGVWRSLVARFVRDEEAVGSNPATPTKPMP